MDKLPAFDKRWIEQARKSAVIEEIAEGRDTFLICVSPGDIGSDRGAFLFVYVKMRTTEAENEKAMLQKFFVAGLKHAEDERIQLEREVAHAQKLKSLGILAGGIAHDFNNILTAILGHAVFTARDGLEAIELFQTHAPDIRCVILDITMPKLDGEAAYSRIHSEAPALPILLCSGYTEHSITERFTGRPIAGFLQKPFTLATLAARLHTALNPNGHQPASGEGI